jgi:hypothetical protein
MLVVLVVNALAAGGLLSGAGPAAAEITAEDGCMEEIADFGLNCTANDVQVANATNIVILDDGCAFPGDLVTFEATFEVVLTAQARHDIGLYFAIDGDESGDGAISGQCSVSTVDYEPEPDWLDLDGTGDGGFCANNANISCESDRDCKSVGGACAFSQDLCGDIDAEHNPLFPVIEITTECIDPDGNGKLNLPNCTSWRQPGANELCLGPFDAYPGAPSKCRCDLGFEVDILVPPATLTVVKTADPTSLDEPGGVVTFSVSVTNDSPFATVALESLGDSVYGDVAQVQGSVLRTTCSLPQALGAGESYACAFDAPVRGLGGTSHTDVVTARGTDENGNAVSGSDDASVDIVDLLPSISVVKNASPTEVLEPGDDVTFSVTVNNTSAVDAVTIDSMIDDIHGNLAGQGDCSVPQTIPVGGSYGCSFTAFVAGSPGDVEIDTVTVRGFDDEDNPLSVSDTATVNVNDVPSTIEVTKTASPTSLDEPGGSVTFTFLVENKSLVDTVTIASLVDSIYGDLHGQGDCSMPQTIAPTGSYTCFVTLHVAGNAFDSVTNVATASGLDDDGNPVRDDDDATVNFDDVAPSASLVKTPTGALVTFEVVVTNDSSAEELTLDALSDDVFGDVTRVQQDVIERTDCAVPQTLARSGQEGDSYRCSFDAWVGSSPHTDTVTGTVSDDEDNVVRPSDDAEVTF